MSGCGRSSDRLHDADRPGPLLWATSSGADVMKRIASPMVGGLVTSRLSSRWRSPGVVTYWRYEQLLWERLVPWRRGC